MGEPAAQPAGGGDLFGRGSKTDQDPRCWRCGRLLAEIVTRPWRIRCGRCKAQNQAE